MQGTFGQESLALDAEQVRIREILRLPVAAGLRETLAAINAAAGDDAHAAVERGELARRLACAASTVSRRCGQLATLGLVLRTKLGNRAAWSIEWSAVFAGEVAERPSGSPRNELREQADLSVATAVECPGGATPVRLAAPGLIGADVVSVVLRCLVLLVCGPSVCARWWLRMDARLRSALETTSARRSGERGAAGVPSSCGEMTPARRARRGRQTLALPFTRDFAVGGGQRPMANSVQSCAPEVMHSPQLAKPNSKEIAASSSGGEKGTETDVKKRYLAIDWEACRTPAGSVEQFSKLLSQGLVSGEDRDTWQMFLNSVRRRVRGEGISGEKLIKSPAAFIGRVVQAGTWREDVKRVDREWWAAEVERMTQPQPVAVGPRDEGRRELTEGGRRFVELLAKKKG